MTASPVARSNPTDEALALLERRGIVFETGLGGK
jgi:hypothetical protein